MQKLIKFFTLSLFFICLSSNTFAWWELGHMAVANIAYQNLNSRAKFKVDALLTEFRKTHSDITTFEEMAVWPDMLTRQKVFLQFHWHFINNPIGDNRPNAVKIDSDNAVWAVNKLKNSFIDNQASVHEQARLLAFLIHIVGDLHQPLHTVAFVNPSHPHGDRGGNDYHVIYQGASTSLHKIYDSGFGAFDNLLVRDDRHATGVSRNIVKTYPAKVFGKKIESLTPESWASEGATIATTFVYNIRENQTLTADYCDKGKQITAEQVALAGYRLANILNDLLGK